MVGGCVCFGPGVVWIPLCRGEALIFFYRGRKEGVINIIKDQGNLSKHA
jgi:hypothetical protein